jgi:conjugal transfer/entry exclusion protein
MKQAARILLGALLLVALTAPHAHAQLAVLDAANLVQNLVTAIQTVFIVANQVLELTGLDEIILDDAFASDMEDLADIVQQAQGLSYDVGSLMSQVNTLFNLDTAPDNTTALRERLAEIRRVTVQSYIYAMRTQTLLQTTLRTVQRLTRLVESIGDFLGNMQANQTLNQVNTTVTEQLAKLQVQSAAYERAQSVERLTEALTIESLHRINEQQMADWPR